MTRTLPANEPRAALSPLHRYLTLVAVVVPFLAFLTAVVLLWNKLVGWTDLAIFGVMYAATGFGVTIGFHRLLTHRSFETHRPVRAVLAALGTMSMQGPVIMWVADHRKHHAFADEEGDPHSPHLDRPPGWRGALKGLWHAHTGWLFDAQGRAQAKRFAPDLLRQPELVWISRHFIEIVLLGLAIPFGLGYALSGSLGGALTALFWGGPVRMFFVHHVTWSVNSVCHFFGYRRFDLEDQSTNVFWLAIPSLGESWHHNHHAFPTAASHGLRWWEIDPSGLVVRAMRRLGLAWNVVEVSPERERSRALTRPERARPLTHG